MAAFAVEPKTDCPHLSTGFRPEKILPSSIDVRAACTNCNNVGENWICLFCGRVACSRHVAGHALLHYKASEHPIAASFSDLSVWCYDCDSYITNPALEPVLQAMRDSKFNVERGGDAPGPTTATGVPSSSSSSSNNRNNNNSDGGAESDQQSDGAEDGDDDDDDEDGSDDIARQLFGRLSLSGKSDEPRTPVLPALNFDGLVQHLKAGKAKNIIVMSGAGISVAAGIPDFRTPGTGLYDNLQKYNLPEPTSVFDISFFREKPEPFYMLAKELYPGNFKPTPAHYFVRLLHEKGLLLRNYTQNIDTLERVAKVPAEMLVEAHGSFGSATCVSCRKPGDVDYVRECVFADKLPRCLSCGVGLVKPDIVFFGESLPARFFQLLSQDFPQCDLLIVMGTSLKVHPFASLIDQVADHVPRVLINRELAGVASAMGIMMGHSDGFRFGLKTNYRDVALLGDLQENIWQLVEALGWKDDLEKLVNEEF